MWPWEVGDDFFDEPAPQTKKKILRVFILYAYMPLSIALMEVFLRLLCGYQFLQGLPFALFFSFSAGFVINAISLAFSKIIISKTIACLFIGIFGIIYSLEYFMYTTYKTFMSFNTILLGAGGVVGEFSDVLVTTVLKGIPVIIGFFIPFAIFIILTRRLVPYTAGDKKERIRCLMSMVLMFGLAVVSQVAILKNSSPDDAAYHTEYNFDSSSRRLGVITGLGLDIRYSMFGNPYTDVAFLHEEPRDGDPQSSETEAFGDLDMSADWDDEVLESVIVVPDKPEPKKPEDYGYNIIDIDFETVNALDSNDKIRSINEYIEELDASRQNEYTGIFEGKNLIFIVAEAFSSEVIDPEMTPTLYRLANSGFYFSDYYQPAWGGSTSSGEFAAIFGLAPVSAASSIKKTIGQNLCYTIGNKLLNQGYFAAAYHNGSNTYYGRDKTHVNFGYPTFTAMGNGMEEVVKSQWPASDLEMMQYSLPQYIDKQPFSIYYMTVSGHCLYSRSGNSMAAKNWDAFPQYEDMPNAIRAYHACNQELEYAMQYLVESLESAGIADDTVIVITTDHYPYGLEKSDSWGTDRDYLNELYGFEVKTAADRDHSSLIIWSGSLENEYEEMAVEVSSPTFSLDILPTLCNLFGVEYDSRMLVGRDVFSDTEAIVFWLDRCWKTDLGFYNAYTDDFIPAEGKKYTYEYIDRVRAVVRNKINYSDSVLNYDYFNVLFNANGTAKRPG